MLYIHSTALSDICPPTDTVKWPTLTVSTAHRIQLGLRDGWPYNSPGSKSSPYVSMRSNGFDTVKLNSLAIMIILTLTNLRFFLFRNFISGGFEDSDFRRKIILFTMRTVIVSFFSSPDWELGAAIDYWAVSFFGQRKKARLVFQGQVLSPASYCCCA